MKNFIFLLFLTLIPAFLSGQNIQVDSADAARLLQVSGYLREARYAEALPIIELLRKSDSGPVSSSASLLFARYQIQTKKYNEAAGILAGIDTSRLEKPLKKEWFFLGSEVSYNLTEFNKSFDLLLSSFPFLSGGEDTIAFFSNLENLSIYFIDEQYIRGKAESYSGSKEAPFLILALAEKLIHTGSAEQAHKLLLDIIQTPPGSFVHEKTSEILVTFKEIFGGEAEARIGVLAVVLPLTNPETGEPNTAGTQVLGGIQFAVDEFNRSNDSNIGIVIYDTRGENSELIRIASEIKQIEGLKAVIGSLFSSETNTLCYLLHDLDVPVISPTATDDSLTISHQRFFQANPSFSIRGESMAQYLVYTEGKRRIAVVYQDQTYASLIAFSFRREFEKLGGRVTLFEPVSSTGSEIQSITANLAVQSTAGTEGLFFPFADKKFISVLNNAFTRTNFKMNLYGNQDWFSIKELALNQQLTDNMVISSDYFVEYASPAYQQFAKQFYDLTGDEPLRNHFYGYDLMAGLLPLVQKHKDENLTEALKKETSFDGFHNSLSFGDGRTNRYMIFFRYKNGGFELIDRFRVSR
ncbi:MAG: hypothetical protein FMNOHCHN_02233 [Ignavibacteriaceae bacterium]|nr:hypothetical protein [Ignavibacteriaceae bacterium]